MKTLSLLFSLLLGAVVLLFLLKPWGTLETNIGGKPSAGAPPEATVESAPAKPPEAAPPPAAGLPPDPSQPKTNMLAAERADAERTAALQQQAAAPREIKRYFKVAVRDNATLEAGPANDKTVIRLEGITPRPPDETCQTGSGERWPCGAKARAALIQLIRARAVTCTLPPGGETKDFAARCSVMDQDLSAWLVRRGWAAPQAADREFAKALDAAKSERLGFWQAE